MTVDLTITLVCEWVCLFCALSVLECNPFLAVCFFTALWQNYWFLFHLQKLALLQSHQFVIFSTLCSWCFRVSLIRCCAFFFCIVDDLQIVHTNIFCIFSPYFILDHKDHKCDFFSFFFFDHLTFNHNLICLSSLCHGPQKCYIVVYGNLRVSFSFCLR